MPRIFSSIDKIRAELAWVNEPVDPNVGGCRHLLCCEQTSHAVGRCPRVPTEKMWSLRQEYFCSECSAYVCARNILREARSDRAAVPRMGDTRILAGGQSTAKVADVHLIVSCPDLTTLSRSP